jgi:hypothetical protein
MLWAPDSGIVVADFVEEYADARFWFLVPS